MDRGSLVASLQNFGQSLARQRMLKESLDDLRKKEAEYERQCKLTERPGTSNPPEESTYDYKRLSAYDEKHKPIQKKPTRIVGWLLCVLCFVLSFVILAPAIYALIMLVLFTLAGYSISETIDVIKSSINEPTSGTFLVGGAAVIGAIIGAWYATAFMAGIIGDLMSESYDERYKKRLNKYFARHKAARLREYKIDLEENYEKSKKISDETKPKLEKTIALIENKRRELAEVNRAIAEYDILPEKYKYPHAVDSITEYIRDMRADSIKEAINLYVVESRERSRENIRRFEEERRLEEMRTAQQEMMYEARRRSDKLQNAQQELIDEERRRRKATEEISDTMKDIKNKLDN